MDKLKICPLGSSLGRDWNQTTAASTSLRSQSRRLGSAAMEKSATAALPAGLQLSGESKSKIGVNKSPTEPTNHKCQN